jgi:excisionase family DNA binding protein
MKEAESISKRLAQMPGAITAEPLARLLGLSRITIYKLAKAGTIPSFRVGNAVRFDPALIVDWLEKR